LRIEIRNVFLSLINLMNEISSKVINIKLDGDLNFCKKLLDDIL